MSGIKIVATVAVKPEYREALLAQFADLVAASRREAGNLRYDLHQAAGSPEKLVFIEHWASQAALDAHNASAHFQNFVKAVEGKNDSIDIVLLQDVSDNA